ncbi:alpha-1,2-fucosyltransferase [Vibrio harveyi]|uniref:alpha-1,2-fucosyltransferase n=1 Tax=Vibrio harveyi TaxID=669 RepID=UPI0018F2761C|nr:alpha-1,2-fucosyltransferase [Vibrio harveyi]
MNKYLLVKIKGGTANQLIQAFVGVEIAKLSNRKVIFDISDFSFGGFITKVKRNTMFSLSEIVTQLGPVTSFPIADATKVFGITQCESRASSYTKLTDILSSKQKFLIMNGYFHQKEFTDLIDKDYLFSFIENCMSDEIKAQHSLLIQDCYCSLHVRRGDYVTSPASLVHGACSVEYYHEALTVASKYVSKFITMSDDYTWVDKSITMPVKTKRSPGNDALEDLYLMTACKVNIISNSSFSWLAGFLNRNVNSFLISPECWFKNAPFTSVLNDGREIVIKNHLV